MRNGGTYVRDAYVRRMPVAHSLAVVLTSPPLPSRNGSGCCIAARFAARAALLSLVDHATARKEGPTDE